MTPGTPYGGSLGAPDPYISDGEERWAVRGALRWRRPCYCADEYVDLLESLDSVPDDSPGWEAADVVAP